MTDSAPGLMTQSPQPEAPARESGPVRSWFRGLRAAFAFLTRLPVGGFPYHAREWQWSSAWFPVVGLAIGGAEAAALVVLVRPGAWVAAASALVVGLLLTGALHEDGLADTADALGGGMDRDGVLRILKDSRVGVFGACALVMSLVLRIALIVALKERAVTAIVVAGCLSRVGPVWLMGTLPYVTPVQTARSRPIMAAGAGQIAMATLTAIAALLITQRFVASWSASALFVVAPVVVAGMTAVCAWRFRARVGGITGDFLGATQQLTLIALLLAWTLS